MSSSRKVRTYPLHLLRLALPLHPFIGYFHRGARSAHVAYAQSTTYGIRYARNPLEGVVCAAILIFLTLNFFHAYVPCADDFGLESVPYWRETWEVYFSRIPQPFSIVQLSVTSFRYVGSEGILAWAECRNAWRNLGMC